MTTLQVQYHVDSMEDLDRLIEEDINNCNKVMVTTLCPKCGGDYTRDVYLLTPPGVLALSICCD